MANTSSFLKKISSGINKRITSIWHNPYKNANLNWFRIKYLKHIAPNKIHSHLLLNHKTFFYDGPGYLHGLQEIFVEEIYAQKLPQNAYILDCGANIGLSVIYLKNICPSAHIICFEPDEKNLELLQKNISSHHLKNVEIKNEAVWTENTSLNFIQEGNMASKIGSDSSVNTMSVKAARLKDYLIQKIDFLKIDIEGAEYNVMKDIADSLDEIGSMFVEYHGKFDQNKELTEIFEIILNAGFKFYIKEAANNYNHPFLTENSNHDYDLQLNIFCFRH
ncbi:MAG: FkbM family methyltransferase [Ginsengibacter sp.]